MKKQALNPYLPSWEYIPDGEPRVFENRVYIYGSHDYYNGHVFCLGDYVGWSAPVDDLGNWRYEGVLYAKTQDPFNKKGKMCLYAPDVVKGPDGRYYLYYVLDKVSVVSVAVCDKPAGAFEFYGYVHYTDGTLLGNKDTDQPQFDPAVLVENDNVYLYTGFCAKEDTSRSGAMVTELLPDMLTILKEPEFIIPSAPYSAGSSFVDHEFFEASSIRKVENRYYFVYSSVLMHELCYATSFSPTKDFTYGGVLISNCDMYIDTYKPGNKPTAYGANNHGGMVEINKEWYIFYHRHTNGTWYSRQGCAQKLQILPNGRIPQVEMTSCGLNGGPLRAEGEYMGYLACNLFTKEDSVYVGGDRFPKVMQDGRDGDEESGYVGNITDSTMIGYKYFDFKNVKKIRIKARGYAKGIFHIKTAWDGQVYASIPIEYSNVWEEYGTEISIEDGVHALYFEYCGEGNASLHSFAFE